MSKAMEFEEESVYLDASAITYQREKLSDIFVKIEQGNWTPTLLNCNYEAPTCVGKYIKIGKCVIIWFHIRPKITALLNGGSAYIVGLPYRPTWPQRFWKSKCLSSYRYRLCSYTIRK